MLKPRGKSEIWVLAGLLGAGCDDTPSTSEPVPLAEGIYAPLGEVRPNATPDERATFERGQAVANRRFTPEEGLGPHFNTSFCGSCHNRPVSGGSAGRYRNFLLTRQTLVDGSSVDTGVNGVQPFLQLEGTARRPLDEGTNLVATRNPIPFFGVGLIAELPAESIMRNADPTDADGDGISGRVNFDRGFVGRFGRKAQTVSLEGFVRGPLFNHMGLTSEPLSPILKDALPVPSGPNALVGTRGQGLSRASSSGVPPIGTTAHGQAAAPDEPTEDQDGVPDPELSQTDLFDLVAFSMLLAAPEPEPREGLSAEGRELFKDVGCESCHIESLAGPRGRLPLWSDLLLHDMGPELADGIQMGLASGREFRTQPLWGVVATGPYLHDGRADTLDEAIRMHGGEASEARDRYLALEMAEQGAVIEFLTSLGGRNQATPGLVPPSEPIPPVGDWGGPLVALTSEEAERFEQGRFEFDRNAFLAEGLGPRFNGDACRACHFEPEVGGAGPKGLNVIRHGRDDGTGFDAPMGTMAHRLLAGPAERAPYDDRANVYEARQAPALFGLGLFELVSEEEILSRADPDDANEDGIRGRPQRLTDGRLGRFGWKGDIPSLAEFVRDALSVELGLTLPDQPGRTFGDRSDDDAVPDPEVSSDVIENIAFWLAFLGPPPSGELPSEGAEIFEQVGCAGCHVPALSLPDGGEVRAYTDLLLHDVLPEGTPGVPVLEAGPLAFRTAPLWGISHTAPFLHDGRASTLEAAIALHDGEAAASAAAVSALGAAERASLIQFLEAL